MRSGLAFALGFALVLPAPAHADVRVTMKDGLVTVTATNATVREILAEWARVGQTKIVNAERISGAPVTIQLTDVPEARALDVVLRSVSGYLAAPRAEINPTLSRFDRILVLPTSTPPRNAPAPAQAPATQPPPFQPPPFQPPPFQPPDDEPNDEPVPRTPAQTAPFSVFPPPPGAPGQPPPSPGSRPAAPPAGRPFGGQMPMGVTVPGMVVPAPAPSGQGVPPRPPDQDQR